MFETGTKRIAKVIGQFDNLSSDLLAGIAELNAETSANDDRISDLKFRNAELDDSRKTALTLNKNILKLMGKTVKTEIESEA